MLAAIVFGVSVAGCATPRPVVRLAPAGGEVTWVAGRAVLSKQQSGVRVAAAFEHQDGDTLAVRVEIANDSRGEAGGGAARRLVRHVQRRGDVRLGAAG